MNIFDNVNSLTASQGKVAIACGNFDGVHRGHQEVFQQLTSYCSTNGISPAIFCFDPHPRKVLSGDSTVKLLTSAEHKLQLFKRYGIKNAVVFHFDRDVAKMSPEAFVRGSLVNTDVAAVFTGKDWRFGRSGMGSVDTLLEMSDELDFQVCPVKEVDFGPEKVSSTNIRDHILAGELDAAEKLLGRRFSILGPVESGEQIAGGKLGIPTANIKVDSEIIPPNGIYAGFIRTGGKLYSGVLNVGYSPTFHDETAPVKVEGHLFGFSGDLYGQNVEVEFVKFIRGEEKFDSIEILKEAISADVASARSILAGCNPTVTE